MQKTIHVTYMNNYLEKYLQAKEKLMSKIEALHKSKIEMERNEYWRKSSALKVRMDALALELGEMEYRHGQICDAKDKGIF